ncbi:MAG: glutamate synthase large subunit [Verrucomicrobiales bacterium]|jgi:glutamate synthase (NADPH/NADH) large chain|nr:glutamate synthase large subunit [Verrucomicrobiales bacterium]
MNSSLVPSVGLYDFKNEHDACGVGLVARLDAVPDHQTVSDGLTVLKNLMHRGATGGDAETGDGAGILISMPDEFFRKQVRQLPAKGRYGVAVLFGADGQEKIVEDIVSVKGGKVLAWREVPTNPNAVGEVARASCPRVRQVIVSGENFEGQAEFERKLFVMRRLIEKKIPGAYVCSFSSKSLVYKGMLMAPQMEPFYPDLTDRDLKSPLALVHPRYSTNTFPTWSLAQPFRFLAHNGEINTLRGNLNHLRARAPYLQSELFGDEIADLLPLIKEEQSDSACLDNMFEMLVAAGRDLCHAMLMLVPQAWGDNYHMGRDIRGFFTYHSALMEPWDGPAALAFSDGVNAGALLDRNGLRPLRYTLTKDNVFVLASETGVLDIPFSQVAKKGRLRPGEIIYCDIENHRLVHDAAIKKLAARRQPYRRWVQENRIGVHGLFSSVTPAVPSANLFQRQRLFGYTREELEMLLKPMAETGQEPVGSMGNDAALAVLSEKPQLLFNYFKQLFAQVTNPPIDPIRENLVMSLTTYIGNQGNILAETPQHARVIKLPRPILTDDELERLRRVNQPGFKAVTIPIGFSGDLGAALRQLALTVVAKAEAGCSIIILSDRDLDPTLTPIPSLLATAVVNKALVAAKRRSESGIIVDTGEAREVMHFALLFGYGATAVCPYVALETVTLLVESGEIKKDIVSAAGNFIAAIDKGLLKTMSKMGISTLRSYRSGQLFEAVGLDQSVIDEYFTGTASRIGGIKLSEIELEARERKAAADADIRVQLLPSGGAYRFRKDGERHLWTPASISAFQHAVQRNDAAKFAEYAALINDQAKNLCTLRGLFELVETKPLPLSEVEPVEAIVKRFVSGAMSLGSISPEAHEAIAIAMNRLGGMSNCGEGGEDPARQTPNADGDDRGSAIRQVASGRFGVTIEYLSQAREIQIKMAQGAKPGEGGQLPGHKVSEFIAKLRHSMPNVSLISPPPHHDIYSIEDLAQLIFDLRNSNPKARISVKLVSEVGVGTIAAGVAKAHSDVVLISGHDGGTGASPLSSIKHAGLPWELGLAETQQTLVLNKLRGRVRLQVDGQIKTGRDVIIGALLGAEEFGFATTVLVALGCVMMRKCHLDSCPVGVATQNSEMRARYKGRPEYIVNFLRFVAEEARGYLARLGLRSLDEAIGRSDLLRMNKAVDFYKTRNLDFTNILRPVTVSGAAQRFIGNDYADFDCHDAKNLLPKLQEAIASGKPAELALTLRNTDRSVGTTLSYHIVKRHGAKGLPEDTVSVKFTGCAGQSFGAFLAGGVTFRLEGEANDYVGKGLSGGKIIITRPADADYDTASNVIAGNVVGYGGTAGKMFICGQAGERFAIRNSGMNIVVEGVGDHGCEYMTGGRVVVLGPTGVNFAAGMTGGLAYVLDETNDFDLRCNIGGIDLENIVDADDEKELLGLLNEHVANTGSVKAGQILANWETYRDKFVKVFPVEYRQALGRMKPADVAAVDRVKARD